MGVKKVLVTGAAGYVAAQMLPEFRRKYELVLLGHSSTASPDGRPVEGIRLVDLADPDRGKYGTLFEGVDAVVHLAYTRRSGKVIDQYANQRTSVDMSYNVLRAAFDAGVPRVAVASSNYADVWYERTLIHSRGLEMLDPYALPLSENFYGWSKAAIENMAFLFASGAFGRKMGVVVIRICSPREMEVERFKDDPGRYKRVLGSYVSPRDLTQLFVKAMETDNIDNEHGVPWHIVYGVSNNTRAFYSLANARQVLDYQPEDDAEIKYAEDIYGFLVGEGAKVGPGRLGP